MVTPASPPAKPTLSDEAYGLVRLLTTVYLPGLSTLYFALSSIWGLPAAEQVVGTIAAVNVFLGLVLAQSRKNYNDSDNPAGRFVGDVSVVKGQSGAEMVNLEFNQPPAQVLAQPEIKLKVKDVTPQQ